MLTALVPLLGGCPGPLPRPDGTAPVSAMVQPIPDGVSVERGTLDSRFGCRFGYRLYQPKEPASDRLVVIGHGFLRDQDQMTGLAVAAAAAGIPAATIGFCSSRPWRGGHRRNADDMIRLADALDATEVIYAGFSAGALAALVAARNDPRAVGVLTLDLVDAQQIGRNAARGLDTPLVGLQGEPTNCNGQGSGEGVYSVARNGRLRLIDGAGHCDFEAPGDRLCRLICQDPTPDEPSPVEHIIATALAELRSLALVE
jgi:hypothetical protein